jgi:hypothetical protein
MKRKRKRRREGRMQVGGEGREGWGKKWVLLWEAVSPWQGVSIDPGRLQEAGCISSCVIYLFMSYTPTISRKVRGGSPSEVVLPTCTEQLSERERVETMSHQPTVWVLMGLFLLKMMPINAVSVPWQESWQQKPFDWHHQVIDEFFR